jgi:hypothetical protein
MHDASIADAAAALAHAHHREQGGSWLLLVRGSRHSQPANLPEVALATALMTSLLASVSSAAADALPMHGSSTPPRGRSRAAFADRHGCPLASGFSPTELAGGQVRETETVAITPSASASTESLFTLVVLRLCLRTLLRFMTATAMTSLPVAAPARPGADDADADAQTRAAQRSTTAVRCCSSRLQHQQRSRHCCHTRTARCLSERADSFPPSSSCATVSAAALAIPRADVRETWNFRQLAYPSLAAI